MIQLNFYIGVANSTPFSWSVVAVSIWTVFVLLLFAFFWVFSFIIYPIKHNESVPKGKPIDNPSVNRLFWAELEESAKGGVSGGGTCSDGGNAGGGGDGAIRVGGNAGGGEGLG